MFDETVMLQALSKSSALPPSELSDMTQQQSSTHVELQIREESILVPTSQSSMEIQSDNISSSLPVMP